MLRKSSECQSDTRFGSRSILYAYSGMSDQGREPKFA